MRPGVAVFALALAACGEPRTEREAPAEGDLAPPSEARPSAPARAAERYPDDAPRDYGARVIGPVPAGRFVAIDGGQHVICALDEQGAAHCFGQQDRFRPPTGRFTAISAGSWHACGLRPEGNLACWGSDYESSVRDAPEGVFVSVGVNVGSCALDAAGAARCWGPGEALPPGRYRRLAVGSSHACALTHEGAIACVESDEMLAGRTELSFEAGARYEALFAGYEHYCALDREGRARCTGRDVDGETDAPDGAFTTLALGEKRSCGLRPDGSAECWGGAAPEPRAGPFDAIAITANEALGEHAFVCAIRRDTRALECWDYSG